MNWSTHKTKQSSFWAQRHPGYGSYALIDAEQIKNNSAKDLAEIYRGKKIKRALP